MIDKRTGDTGIDIAGNQLKRTIQRSSHRPELPEFLVTERDLLEHKKIPRIEFESSLQAPSGFAPESLAAIHVAG